MASLFEIGKTGVQAYRQALSVTGQNIANINTEGYNKRAADITEISGVSGGATNVTDLPMSNKDAIYLLSSNCKWG